MQQQGSFSRVEYAGNKKQAGPDRFLSEIEQVVPWARLVDRRRRFYVKEIPPRVDETSPAIDETPSAVDENVEPRFLIEKLYAAERQQALIYDILKTYGTMVAISNGEHIRFAFNDLSLPNARTHPTITLMGGLIKECSKFHPLGEALVIQYDDRAHMNVDSIAYGRRRGEMSNVSLIPDVWFFQTNGFTALRDAIACGSLPPWNDRKDQVFWRGSATTNYLGLDGRIISGADQIPRIALCRILKEHLHADVAIMHPWDLPYEGVVEFLQAENIYRPRIPMIDHANYRYLIDIDGVANAWSFFEKLLLGSCILKADSAFEQWFYDKLTPWQHFVPVNPDLSDLLEKVDWCLQHRSDAQVIGQNGQSFALQHTFETAKQITFHAIRSASICVPRG